MSAPRFKLPRVGVCRVCGCTDDNACQPDNCWWVDRLQSLCSTCSGTAGDLAYAMAWVRYLAGRPGERRRLVENIYVITNGAIRRFRERASADDRDSQRG